MDIWDTYEARIDLHGVTKREHNISRTADYISRKIKDSPSLKKVSFDDVEQELVVIDHKEDFNIKKVCTLPGETIKCGSIMMWKDEAWLITIVDANNEIYTSGQAERCNYLLRWLNDEGDIVERWCIVKDTTQNSTAITDGTYINVGDARTNIIIGKDAETMKIRRDKRFLVNDLDQAEVLAYKVVKPSLLYNVYKGEGVYKLILNETVLTDYDNPELLIADYYNWHSPTSGIESNPTDKFTPEEVKELEKNEPETDGKKVWI